MVWIYYLHKAGEIKFNYYTILEIRWDWKFEEGIRILLFNTNKGTTWYCANTILKMHNGKLIFSNIIDFYTLK